MRHPAADLNSAVLSFRPTGRIDLTYASRDRSPATAVEGLTAAHYRRVISEKTRDALARLRAKGRRVSRWAPYGFRFGPGGRLLASPKEQAALGRIAALHSAGLSLRATSTALAAEGSAPATDGRSALNAPGACSQPHGCEQPHGVLEFAACPLRGFGVYPEGCSPTHLGTSC